MSMDFSGAAGAATSFDTIPHGQLAWAILDVRALSGSRSGGQYLDCELVIAEGQPFAGRKLWEMIGDPAHTGNSEAYRQMGQVAICRILEAGKGASPNNVGAYKIENYEQLSGLKVAIKVGLEPGKDGHQDKNRVAEFLTPNPASASGHRGFEALLAKRYDEFVKKPTPAAQASMGFGNTPAPAAAPSGFAAAGGQPAEGASGFSNASSAAPAGQTVTGFATTASAPSASPSDSPGWLTQANAQGNG